MAARGQEEKALVAQKIMEMFPGAFEYDKVIRIPVGDLEIKVALTAAKDVVGGGNAATQVESAEGSAPAAADVAPPTEEEIKNVQNLMKNLGL